MGIGKSVTLVTFSLITVIGFFSLILIFQPTFADHPLYGMVVWQKGVATFAEDDDSQTGMTLTLPSGKINSQSILLNYVDAFTDQYDNSKLRNGGGFMQVGIVYPNLQQSGSPYDDMSFFYSDGVEPFPIEHPYNVGAKYTFQIYYNKDWWIYITDDVSGKRTFIKPDWASGKLTRADIVLENIGSTHLYQTDYKSNTLTQTKDVGTLSNIVDQRFFIGSIDESRIPSNVIQGWDYESQVMTVDLHLLSQHIVPPQFALFENNNGIYEVGFESVSNPELKVEIQELPTPEPEPEPVCGTGTVLKNGVCVVERPQSTPQITTSKLPNWIKNNAAWWSSGVIEDRDFSKGIEFMIKVGIIRIPQVQTDKEMATFSVGKIPDWIKNNAKWWSEGKISDDDFSTGIEYMVKVGIIKI